MPGMSLGLPPAQPTARAFIRHPRRIPPRVHRRKKVLFVYFLLTSTHGGMHTCTATCQASGKIKLKQAPTEGAASLRQRLVA